MLKQRDRLAGVFRGIIARLNTGTPSEGGVPSIKSKIFLNAGGDGGAFGLANVPIHQSVPKDLNAPFIAFRDTDSKIFGSKTCPGEDININFLIVSQYAGYLEASNIADAILVQLTSGALDLSPDGMRVVMLQLGNQLTAPLSDGRTITRLLPMRIIVEDLAIQDPQQGG